MVAALTQMFARLDHAGVSEVEHLLFKRTRNTKHGEEADFPEPAGAASRGLGGASGNGGLVLTVEEEAEDAAEEAGEQDDREGFASSTDDDDGDEEEDEN